MLWARRSVRNVSSIAGLRAVSEMPLEFFHLRSKTSEREEAEP